MKSISSLKVTFQSRMLFFVTLIALIVLVNLSACTTNHYFSVNAEEMTNPSIEYRDSTNLQKPW